MIIMAEPQPVLRANAEAEETTRKGDINNDNLSLTNVVLKGASA